MCQKLAILFVSFKVFMALYCNVIQVSFLLSISIIVITARDTSYTLLLAILPKTLPIKLAFGRVDLYLWCPGTYRKEHNQVLFWKNAIKMVTLLAIEQTCHWNWSNAVPLACQMEPQGQFFIQYHLIYHVFAGTLASRRLLYKFAWYWQDQKNAEDLRPIRTQ
jgi:hypothetical protein